MIFYEETLSNSGKFMEFSASQFPDTALKFSRHKVKFRIQDHY